MSWQNEVSSLLDDILNDKEPEVTEESATPEPQQPETQEVEEPTPELDDDALEEVAQAARDEALSSQPAKVDPLSPDITLADILKDEATPVQEPEPEAEEVTTVVTSDPSLKVDMSAWSEEVEDSDELSLPSFTDQDLMEAIDVRNFGTLVTLTNRRWHAKKKDRNAALDAAKAAGAAKEAFESHKRLLTGCDEKLKAVHKCIDDARNTHYEMTMPWSTIGVNDHGKRQGGRLLPNTRFFDYVEAMGKYKADMDTKLDEFVDAYPDLIAMVQQKLGRAFDTTDYPKPSVIREYFTLEFDFEPIPSSSDYVGLQEAQAEKLGHALRKKTQQRLENALQDAWAKVYRDVSHAASVLGDPNKSFQKSTIDKLRAHAENLRHCNVTMDKRVEQVRHLIETTLTSHDAKAIREDDVLRRDIAEKAKAVQQVMEGYADKEDKK